MAINDRVTSDKRDFTRLPINAQVTIRHEGNKYQGVCKNLSGAGVSIETEQAFEIGAELQLTITQDNDKYQPFIAEATVTRLQAGTQGKLILGLSIKEIFD